MFLVILISEENLRLITGYNGGVVPEVEDEETFFVHNLMTGESTILDNVEFNLKFKVALIINARRGRYQADMR